MVDLTQSFVWADLDENDRYTVWSAHMNAGGQDMDYVRFCNAMDFIANTA